MRNMRGALWALGLAAAAYAWRNRAQLQQRFGRSGQPNPPRQLPDYSSKEEQVAPERDGGWEQRRTPQYGGTDV